MSDTPQRHGMAPAIAALLLAALLYRLAFLLAMPRVLDNADAIHYVETASHFLAGDFAAADPKIPILYPALGALAGLVIKDMEWACRLVSFLASVLLVVPVYGLARKLHGHRAALIAGLTVVLWPWLADYGCRVSTEAVAVLLWLLGAWCLVTGIERGGALPWLAGLAFGALHLARPEGTLVMLAAPVAGVWLVRESSGTWRRLVPLAVVAVAAIALTTAYNRATVGEATANYRVGFIVQEFDWLRFGQTGLATMSDVLPVMLGPVLFFFLGAGFLLPRTRPRRLNAEWCVLTLCLVQWGASLFVLSPAPRYLMAPLVVLSMWSAAGMALSMDLTRSRLVRAFPVTALVLAMLASGATTLASEHLGRRPRQPREYKEAGRWMQQNLDPGLIFTRKPQVGYYAGMKSTGPALEDSMAAALSRAREAGARYLVVDERYTAQSVPGLRSLLAPENAPSGLHHLKTFDSYPDAKVVIYGLEPATP